MKLSYSGHNMDHMEICRILVIFDGKRQKMNRINDLLIETALVSILNLILPVQISSSYLVPRGEDVE